MRNIVNTIKVSALFMIFCLAACKKTHSYMVHGQIVDSTVTPNVPISNTSFVLTVFEEGATISSPTQKTPYTFTTDNNGNFSVSFDAKNLIDLGLSYPSGSLIPLQAQEVASNKYDYDLGIVKTKKL